MTYQPAFIPGILIRMLSMIPGMESQTYLQSSLSCDMIHQVHSSTPGGVV